MAGNANDKIIKTLKVADVNRNNENDAGGSHGTE